MKPSKVLIWLSALVVVLATAAASVGVFSGGGPGPREFTTVMGETVTLYGQGIYRNDWAGLAVQGKAQDMVTLMIGVPLLLVSIGLYRQGKVRGQILLTGTMAYFLYTYTSMAFGSAYNALFLLYVALFSLCLYTFIWLMAGVDLAALPGRFTDKLPRRTIAGLMFFAAGFLFLAWMGRIVPALVAGTPPFGLNSSSTLFIQVMDLGIIVPMLMLAGVFLLRRRPLGYLLASVGLVKFTTMGLAIIAMIVGQWLAGEPMSLAEATIFPAITLFAIVLAALMLRDLHEDAPVQAQGQPAPSTR